MSVVADDVDALEGLLLKNKRPPSDPVREGLFVKSSLLQQQLVMVEVVEVVDTLHCEGRLLLLESGVNQVLKVCHFDLMVVWVGECTSGCIVKERKNSNQLSYL
jgi:hypothetical protein